MKKFKEVQKITDPSLDPYFITRDDNCFTVKELVQPNSGHFRTQGKGKSYEKALCYFPKFESAIDKISRLKMDKSEYTSIRSYIDEYEQVNNNLINFLKEA